VFKSTCFALLLLVPTVAAAQKGQQGPPPASTITMQIPGLNCSTPAGSGTFAVTSWSWGVSNSGTFSGGTSAGKASLQDLHITKAFDGCSPALLGLVTTGGHLKEVVLTQTASDGTKAATVVLEDALVSSWQLGSTTAQQSPSEQVSFNFRKVCVTDTFSGAKACFDLGTLKP
jgi:type VI secretion system Hcp family effector